MRKGEESLPTYLPNMEMGDGEFRSKEFKTVEFAVSLPKNLPDEYTYVVIDDGQFRVKEIDTAESAKVSFQRKYTVSHTHRFQHYCLLFSMHLFLQYITVVIIASELIL